MAPDRYKNAKLLMPGPQFFPRHDAIAPSTLESWRHGARKIGKLAPWLPLKFLFFSLFLNRVPVTFRQL